MTVGTGVNPNSDEESYQRLAKVLYNSINKISPDYIVFFASEISMNTIDYVKELFEADDDVFTIYTEPEDFSGVRDDLEKLGYVFVSAELEMVPSTYAKIEDEETAVKMQKMLDMFDDNDDIQNVWHNWEMPEE